MTRKILVEVKSIINIWFYTWKRKMRKIAFSIFITKFSNKNDFHWRFSNWMIFFLLVQDTHLLLSESIILDGLMATMKIFIISGKSIKSVFQVVFQFIFSCQYSHGIFFSLKLIEHQYCLYFFFPKVGEFHWIETI